MFIKYFHAIVPYFTIKSNIFFLLLYIDNSLEQHTGFRTFIFTTGDQLKQPVYVCIWPSDWMGDLQPLLNYILIGFRLCPYREIVWHLSTQANNSILSIYITVFDPRRGKRRCFIPFLVYSLVYPSIDSNLVTLATLSPRSDSVYTHTCSPFLSKPLLG